MQFKLSHSTLGQQELPSTLRQRYRQPGDLSIDNGGRKVQDLVANQRCVVDTTALTQSISEVSKNSTNELQWYSIPRAAL